MLQPINVGRIESSHMCNAAATEIIPLVNALIAEVQSLRKAVDSLAKPEAPKAPALVKKTTTRRAKKI